MPKMKYFQQIGDMSTRREDLLKKATGKHGNRYIEELKENGKTIEDVKKEMDALDYLLGCQLGLAHGNEDYIKPDKQFLIGVFQDSLDSLKKEYFDESSDPMGPQLKKFITKQVKACEYYLFKLGYEEWFKKLPDRILTIEHKYPDMNNNLTNNKQDNDLDLD